MNEETKKTTKPFHLIITNNETGETVRELDFDALIGTAHTGEHESCGLVLSKCNGLVMAETLASVASTVKQVEDENQMEAFVAKIMFEASIEEPENQEENEEKGE